MAKEVFQRSKPHVNIGLLLPAVQKVRTEGWDKRQELRPVLQQLGVSPAGAEAFVEGNFVASLVDRQQIIAILIGLLL